MQVEEPFGFTTSFLHWLQSGVQPPAKQGGQFSQSIFYHVYISCLCRRPQFLQFFRRRRSRSCTMLRPQKALVWRDGERRAQPSHLCTFSGTALCLAPFSCTPPGALQVWLHVRKISSTVQFCLGSRRRGNLTLIGSDMVLFTIFIYHLYCYWTLLNPLLETNKHFRTWKLMLGGRRSGFLLGKVATCQVRTVSFIGCNPPQK